MKIPYTKMHGCHNDYIYIDNLDGNFSEFMSKDLSKISIRISDRKTGIGSDGLIVIHPPVEPQSGVVARMQMFNADGSEGKMCGNGIRCIAKLLYEKLGPKSSYKIETLSGVRECFVLEAQDPERLIVKVNMGRPSFLPAKIPVLFDDVMVLDEDFEVLDKVFKISCVSMGNPHCVTEVKDLENFEVSKYGPVIEKHEVFPEGVNIEFIEYREGKLFQRTWERGSGETQACGTGACAVGVTQIMSKKRSSPVNIRLKGGELTIEWDGLREVWMTGEAVTESAGVLDSENF